MKPTDGPKTFTDDYLCYLESLLASPSPLPWDIELRKNGWAIGADGCYVVDGDELTEADARLVVAAVNNLKDLIREVRHLRRQSELFKTAVTDELHLDMRKILDRIKHE